MTIFLQTKIDTLNKQQKDQQQVFKPLFYRISKENDRQALSLLLDKPGLSVHDYLFDQVKELMKISHPNLKLNAEQQEEAAQKHIHPLSMEEYGVWVYYPWANRLVHIVDEQEFIELRTSRNQYKITREERDLLAQKKIGVIGLSVGQSVATTLAMERIAGEIRLADFDVLELTNLNRIRTSIHNLGLPKVYAVAREIAEIDPFILVKCFPEGITEDNMNDFLIESGKLDLILEESDSLDIKVLIRYKAKELGIPVVMESSDRCMVDVERFDLEPSRKVLHGLIDKLDIPTLKSLKTNEEKIPYALAILGADTLSSRLKMSMGEIGKTITTWPQLASAVTMGGGIAADVSRRLLLHEFTSSGRYYVDVETIISDASCSVQYSRETSHFDPLTMEEMNNLIHQLNPIGNSHPIPDQFCQQLIETCKKKLEPSESMKWSWLSKNNVLYIFNENKTAFTPQEQHSTILALGASLRHISFLAQQMQLSPIVQIYPLHKDERLIAKITFSSNKLH